MKLIITGSPGVGKTSVSKELGVKIDGIVMNEKEFALKVGIGEWDNEENELVIPLNTLKTKVNAFLKEQENVILEGHLLCEIKGKCDYCVVITLDPELLEERLERKRYRQVKIQDNVFCEGVEYCKKHASRNYAKNKLIVVESKKTIKETCDLIIRELREKGAEI